MLRISAHYCMEVLVVFSREDTGGLWFTLRLVRSTNGHNLSLGGIRI